MKDTVAPKTVTPPHPAWWIPQFISCLLVFFFQWSLQLAMDLCTKSSDMISWVHFCSTFSLKHPASSAVETKLWNCFVICIKELLPCKNTPVIVLFSLYTDTVPEISLALVLRLWLQGQKKFTTSKRKKRRFCKEKELGVWLGWEYLNVAMVLILPEERVVLWD